MDTYEQVHGYLNRLGLTVTEQILDNYLESVKDKPFMEIFNHLLEQEVDLSPLILDTFLRFQ